MKKRHVKSPKNQRLDWQLYLSLTIVVLLATPVMILLQKNSDPYSQVQASTVTPVGQTGNWNMIFSDEFEGTTLDETKWIKCREWGQKGQPCESTTTPKMTYLPENVIVGNGIVRLQAQKGTFTGSKGQTYSYSSGMIATAKYYDDTNPIRFQHKYGYMESRIKVPKGQGLWPAFWNVASNGDWPPEIDIMENLTSSTTDTFEHHMHYHYNDNTGTHRDSGASWTSTVDLANDYHVYAVSWEPNAIKWYVDGIERRSAFVDTQYISAQDMFLILNLQIGGSWPGDPDSSTPFPSYMDIDYVRVWQAGSPTTATPTPLPVEPTNTPVPTATIPPAQSTAAPASVRVSSLDIKAKTKNTPATVSYTLQTTGSLQVSNVGVAVRNQNGQNYDFPGSGTTTLSGTQAYKVSRTFPKGNYSYWVFYAVNGQYYNLTPTKTFSIK